MSNPSRRGGYFGKFFSSRKKKVKQAVSSSTSVRNWEEKKFGKNSSLLADLVPGFGGGPGVGKNLIFFCFGIVFEVSFWAE